MSDPAKSSDEIEDVLSSIRRLVSENQPGPDGSMRARPREPDPAEEPDRLVLTSAFRVADADDPWAPVRPRDEDTPPAPEAAVPIEPPPWTPDDRMAAFGTVAGDAPEDVAADGAADVPEAAHKGADEGVTSTTIPDADAPANVADAPVSDGHDLDNGANAAGSDGNAKETAFDQAVETLTEELTEAILAKVVTATEGDAPASRRDGAVDAVPAGAKSAPGATPEAMDASAAKAERPEAALDPDVKASLAGILDPSATPLDGQGFEPESGDTAWPDPVAGRAARDLAAVRGAKPASASAAPNSETTDPAPEPGAELADPGFERVFSRPPAAPEGPTAPDAVPHEAPAPAQTTSEIAPERDRQTVDVEDLGEQHAPFTFPERDDGTVMDEETLREIIAEVVREELQGALGQRITRNVRKMVRREIRLMIAADDVD